MSDPKSGPTEKDTWFAGDAGLNQSDLDHVSDAERDTFLSAFAISHGPDPYGPWFFVDNGLPGHMKRYRLLVTNMLNTDPKGDRSFYPLMVGEMVWYCQGGFREGVRYVVVQSQVCGDGTGMSKAQILESMALAFWWTGSRGMREIQEALKGYQWVEPERPVPMPPGWAADPDAFKSGLDFSTPTLSKKELQSLEEWYLKYEGEMPPHVRFLAKHRPNALKAFRNRFESTLRILPKQWAPYAMVQVNAQRGYGPGIREGVLLGKGFGMTKEQILWACGAAQLFGGIDCLGLVEQVAGDVLDKW